MDRLSRVLNKDSDDSLIGMFFYVESCKKNAHDKNCREGWINVELFCVVDRPYKDVHKKYQEGTVKWEINI